ncbi:hypothetical protein I4902_18755 [Proteus alimentorum]|uniref:Uncharacterized protein n=1 Tax=Proteus alimentorum TaxID=1973495 RepID=A0ABS0IZ73_9GAMM|nr:hypothetical protein [Proteus alimentorum]MBG2877654.1 hypothetical protein [Proteus alimentorum]MBG2881283.1 hypothetical protein [Proteus alimentorum]
MKKNILDIINSANSVLEHTTSILESLNENLAKLNSSIEAFSLKRAHNRPIEYEIKNIKCLLKSNELNKQQLPQYMKTLSDIKSFKKEFEDLDKDVKKIYLEMIPKTNSIDDEILIIEKEISILSSNILTDSEVNILIDKIIELKKLLKE